jgi:hypothetical protein
MSQTDVVEGQIMVNALEWHEHRTSTWIKARGLVLRANPRATDISFSGSTEVSPYFVEIRYALFFPKQHEEGHQMREQESLL